MVEINNPAGRLATLMERGRDNRPLHSSQIIQAWSVLLGIDITRPAMLVRQIGIIAELPGQVAVGIRQLDGVNHDRYLSWVPNAHAKLNDFNLSNHFANLITGFSPDVLSLIWICDENLSRLSPERVISNSDLEALRKNVDTLFGQVTLVQMDGDLKRFLLKHLEIMQLALQDYKLQGIAAIESAVEAVVGSIGLHKPVAEKAYSTPAGQQVLQVLGNVMAVVNVADKGIKLFEWIATKLLPG